MHISLILDEPEHQIAFLKGFGFNPTAVITSEILLINRRSCCYKITLFIQQVQRILTCLLIISFNISCHTGRVVTDVTRKNSLRSIDLQNNVKSQQEEATKTKEELTKSLAAMEKLKESFNKDRVEWEIEKSGLIKSAEDAKASLKPVVEELAGLKRQINAMTSAIFGKYCLPKLYEYSV